MATLFSIEVSVSEIPLQSIVNSPKHQIQYRSGRPDKTGTDKPSSKTGIDRPGTKVRIVLVPKLE